MVARYIPTFMAIGAVLAGYRLLGVGDFFKEFIKKDLQPAYDYVIGRSPFVSRFRPVLLVMGCVAMCCPGRLYENCAELR